MRLLPVLLLTLLCGACAGAPAPTTAATSQPVGKLPNIQVDVKKRQIRVDCEALNVDMPLEFFCVVNGTNEHESVLRTPAKPSDIHLALLMLGLEPGEPVHYSEAKKEWIAPHGPPLHVSIEYEKDGKLLTEPAYRWMRSVKDKKEMPPMTWIFAGSKVMPDGLYAADRVGYVVSVVNFDLSLIDIPDLASNANETLVWQTNLDRVPKTGTKVVMIIEPAGKVESTGVTTTKDGVDSPHESAKLQSATTAPSDNLTNVAVDDEMIKKLRAK